MTPDPAVPRFRNVLQARRKAIAAGIVLAGFLAGLVIWVTATISPEGPLGRPEDSKRYLREMEVYGGKANLMAGEIREWLDGLWHGRRLGVTVAALSLLAAGAFLFAFTPLPPADGPAGEKDGKSRPDPDGGT